MAKVAIETPLFEHIFTIAGISEAAIHLYNNLFKEITLTLYVISSAFPRSQEIIHFQH